MADASHPREPEIVEYVAGVMPADERRAFAAAIAADPSLGRAVTRWAETLSGLAEAVEPVPPPDALWGRIERSVGAGVAPAPRADPLGALRRSRARWRAAAGGFAALAAALVFAIGLGRGRVAGGTGPGSFVAVVNRTGDLPSLIVRVDPAGGTVQVRSVAADVPAGRSLELWSVPAGAAPRSLGLVSGPTTHLAWPRGAAPYSGEGTVIAVSVEPPDGSPTGAPTGPVVYSGRLVPEVP